MTLLFSSNIYERKRVKDNALHQPFPMVESGNRRILKTLWF